MSSSHNTGPLSGICVLDLSRILAGPSATQILGDLGAEIIKVERPNIGDDTRKWGPPFLTNKEGQASTESSYYLSTNRNKKSITIDFRQEEGQKLIHQLIAKADILVENYKTGGLAKYGLDYPSLKEQYPHLIYASLTGFGQTGPLSKQAGYDFLIQAMGGIMSLTGEPDGMPMKTGVAISDLMAGMYLNTAVLAALHHKNKTGHGQHIDLSLYDSQIAWLSNAGQYYLTSGNQTPRMGNAHPTIVPYEVFEASDGHFVLAIGNDRQFADFCKVANCSELSENPDYQTNDARVKNRHILVPILQDIIKTKPKDTWIDLLEKEHVPTGNVQTISEVFNHPQTTAREMVINMAHPDTDQDIKLIGNPIKMSETPVSYRHAPPKMGANTDDILTEILHLSDDEVADLKSKKII